MNSQDLQSDGRKLIFTAQACDRCVKILEEKALAAAAQGQELPQGLPGKIGIIRMAADFLRECGKQILEDSFKRQGVEP